MGLYGKPLPNQDGAPIRLVVPWKYGFKSIKSIVKISFVDEQPPTSWNRSASNEYGFYSNVNPNAIIPAGARSRSDASKIFFKRKTLMFNGYSRSSCRNVLPEWICARISNVGLLSSHSATKQSMNFSNAASSFKPVVFIACLVPIILLAWNGLNGNLSANPISDITNETGIWTLRLLVITLSITPLRKITNWHCLIKFRRMTGLFAFFYGGIHFITYIWLDQFFDVESMVTDVSKRPFITVGLSSFVLMIPLSNHIDSEDDQKTRRKKMGYSSSAGVSVQPLAVSFIIYGWSR